MATPGDGTTAGTALERVAKLQRKLRRIEAQLRTLGGSDSDNDSEEDTALSAVGSQQLQRQQTSGGRKRARPDEAEDARRVCASDARVQGAVMATLNMLHERRFRLKVRRYGHCETIMYQ